MERLKYYKNCDLKSRSGQMIPLKAGSTSCKYKSLQAKAVTNRKRTDFTFKANRCTLWFEELRPRDTAYVGRDRVNFREGEVDLFMTSMRRKEIIYEKFKRWR